MAELILKFEGEGSDLANQILAETRNHWPHHLMLLLADTYNAMSDQPEFKDKVKRLKQYRDIFNLLWARDCDSMVEQCLEKLRKGYLKGNFEDILTDICGKKPKNYISNLSAWFFEDGTSVQKTFEDYIYSGGGSGPPRYDD